MMLFTASQLWCFSTRATIGALHNTSYHWCSHHQSSLAHIATSHHGCFSQLANIGASHHQQPLITKCGLPIVTTRKYKFLTTCGLSMSFVYDRHTINLKPKRSIKKKVKIKSEYVWGVLSEACIIMCMRAPWFTACDLFCPPGRWRIAIQSASTNVLSLICFSVVWGITADGSADQNG